MIGDQGTTLRCTKERQTFDEWSALCFVENHLYVLNDIFGTEARYLRYSVSTFLLHTFIVASHILK